LGGEKQQREFMRKNTRLPAIADGGGGCLSGLVVSSAAGRSQVEEKMREGFVGCCCWEEIFEDLVMFFLRDIFTVPLAGYQTAKKIFTHSDDHHHHQHT
jgi:hypothetical protein